MLQATYDTSSIQLLNAAAPGCQMQGAPLGFDLQPEMESKVRLGTALVGSAVGAAALALLFGGSSRILAAAAGAGGAFAGGLLTSFVGNQIITYKRVASTAKTAMDTAKTEAGKLGWGGYPGYVRRWGGGPWGIRNGYQ